ECRLPRSAAARRAPCRRRGLLPRAPAPAAGGRGPGRAGDDGAA
ncbi:MAG: hypothetical protein AVDCRST_MAG52-802, partial [uncultured Blastococcus sp.]